MEIKMLAKHRMLVARLSGEIDHRAAAEAREVLEREIKRSGAINIGLDFGRVTFMDSSGIGMIIGRYRTVSALGGAVVIYDASESVVRLLEMAGVDRLAVISGTLQEGIRKLKGAVK